MENFAAHHNLIEGNWYDFLVLKKIAFADDEYYVLETPGKTKITIPAIPYENYLFKENQTISCKVDKISCSGKIYIEPKHPIYEVGKIYDFPIVQIKTTRCLFGNEMYLLYVHDVFNQRIEIPISNYIDINESISLKIARIKKGKIYAYPNRAPFEAYFNDGQMITLIFMHKYYNFDNEIMYVAQDEFSCWHLIPAKYFPNYLILYHQTIRAKVSKHPTNDYFYIEPEHPVYKTDSIYSFEIVDIEINTNNVNKNGFTEQNLTVRDKDKNDYQVQFFSNEHFLKNDIIQLKALGIRKGQMKFDLP